MYINSPTKKMLATIENGIGWITFNAPDRHNAMSLDMWQGLAEILRQMSEVDSLRVIVLKGAGDKAFVSGADISEFEEKRSSQEDREIYEAAFDDAHKTLSSFPKPVIAMIQGFCVGGGLAIARNADIRIATDNSVFGIPAARLGLGYGFEAIKILESIVGPSHAKDILFTARFLNTEEALRIGLINFVVSYEEWESTINDYVHKIAANAPLTIKAVKATVAELVRDPGQQSPEYIDKLVNDCFLSDDYKEGRTAFLEKRKANFKGS